MELISSFLFAIALFLGGGLLAGAMVALVLLFVWWSVVGIRRLIRRIA
jgi:hypothetical protein